MDFNNVFQSKSFKIAVWAIAAAIVLLLVFKMGMAVGFRKASFSYKWGENYHKNFAGPRRGFFSDFKGKDFMEANGAIGQIIKIDGSAVVIKGRDNIEKIVLVKDNTIIRRFRESVKISDIKIDDNIVVIGEPNDFGQIEAKFIRLLPSSSQKTTGVKLKHS